MDIDDYEVEYKDVNNNLVVPSYREFCKKNGLLFHFWDELPEVKFDPAIADKESKLHREAMQIFNALKDEVVLFREKVIRFQFTDWGGAFEFDAWPLKDYLETTSEIIINAKVWEKQAKILIKILQLTIGLFVAVLTMFIDVKFFHIEQTWLTLTFALGIAIGIANLIKHIFWFRPFKQLEAKKCGFKNRLQLLKNEFQGEPYIRIKQKYLEEKADNLVDSCRTFLGIIQPSYYRQYPELLTLSDDTKITFYGTIAFAYCACVRLHFDVDEEHRTPLELIVQKQLREWHPEAIAEYESLLKFISQQLLKEPDRGKRGDLLFELAGRWAVLKVTNEDIVKGKGFAIAKTLADLFLQEISGYWGNSN